MSGVVVLAFDLLDHGLAALHVLRVGIEGVGGRAVQGPALVQRRRHLVAEGRVVRAGEEAVRVSKSCLSFFDEVRLGGEREGLVEVQPLDHPAAED